MKIVWATTAAYPIVLGTDQREYNSGGGSWDSERGMQQKEIVAGWCEPTPGFEMLSAVMRSEKEKADPPRTKVREG